MPGQKILILRSKATTKYKQMISTYQEYLVKRTNSKLVKDVFTTKICKSLRASSYTL